LLPQPSTKTGGWAMSDILIEQALDFYKEGDKQRAGALLKEVIEYDPGHIDALYGLSLCTENPEEKAYYLKQILALNPHHVKAQQALSRLEPEESPAKQPRRSLFKFVFGKKN
jgi:hypothetical protein